jgi:hypothetical protein
MIFWLQKCLSSITKFHLISKENNVLKYLIPAAILALSLNANAQSTTDAGAQTIPDCKRVFPGFQGLDDLNKQPGTITEDEFQRKLLTLDAGFGGLHPSQKQIADVKAYLESSNIQQDIIKLKDGEDKMAARRAILEDAVAKALDVRKLSPGEEGSTALLYCQFASQLAITTYEQQQDHYYLQLGLHIVHYAQQVAKISN